MVKSMTGYGRNEQTIHDRTFVVEVKSVNNRYLDCSVRLPRNYGFAEKSIKTRVQQIVSRGKVDVFVTIESTQSETGVISLNQPLAESYLNAFREISEIYGIENDITVSQLTHFPDILISETLPIDQNMLEKDLNTVLDFALAEYDKTRITEGERIKADLFSKLDRLEGMLLQIEARSPETVQAYQKRLYEKLREVLESTQIDESRILTEAAVFADKVAVDEETVRLHSHIARFRTMLTKGGVVGKQIDFLIQEMNRESNTIGSKCTDLTISHIIVDMKSEIEKLREQIQNIE